jgi:hypothetical protein
VDVPSATTGTGDALLLDGRDTALVRVAFVAGPHDALVSTATQRVTWRVVSGPGRVAGISNGDPSSHEWLKSTSVNAWGGLARGLFRVTRDCVSAGRDIATSQVDVDGPRTGTVVPSTGNCPVAPIVVEASAEGLAPVRASIRTSTNTAADGVWAVAGRTVKSDFSYLETFVG